MRSRKPELWKFLKVKPIDSPASRGTTGFFDNLSVYPTCVLMHTRPRPWKEEQRSTLRVMQKFAHQQYKKWLV